MFCRALSRALRPPRGNLVNVTRPNVPSHWQGWQGSNPQPPVLETGALPVELHPYTVRRQPSSETRLRRRARLARKPSAIKNFSDPSRGLEKSLVFRPYSTIDATTPAPTVRPPSRIAKRRPSSIAIGAIKVTSIEMLSPGITISTPSGRTTEPVTSVVRK